MDTQRPTTRISTPPTTAAEQRQQCEVVGRVSSSNKEGNVKDRYSRIEAARRRRQALAQMDEAALGTIDQILDNGDLITKGAFRPKVTAYVPDAAPDYNDERTVYTVADPEKQADMRAEWDATQFRLSRSSVVPLSAADETPVEVDGVRFPGRYEVDEKWERSEAALDFEATGVAFEYARRKQGRQPWMPKSTYRFVMDCDRKRRRALLLRTAIINIVRQLGEDPRDPKVAEWVSEVGYERAFEKLSDRLADAIVVGRV